MAITNNNPDLLYVKSRDSLLLYEDARLNSLLQSVANFYTTRNDQSIWGNFLRALARELGQLDFGYSYDLVNKDPKYLTPPDISRRWAAPLYLDGYWPTKTQFDLDFKKMMVLLLAAYREGCTVQSIEDVIFAYTGLRIHVQELYRYIGDGVHDESDRNSISVSVNATNVGVNPLSGATSALTTFAQLQTVVQSLYGAIDLAKPAHVGVEFTTIFGDGEQLDCMLSPAYLTQQQYLAMAAPVRAFYTHVGYELVNPVLHWAPGATGANPYDKDTLLRDRNGNLQLTATGGFPGHTEPAWGPDLGDTTPDGTILWENVKLADPSPFVPASLPGEMTKADYNALDPKLQPLYQRFWANTNCPSCHTRPFLPLDATGPTGCVAGIDDLLRIFVHLVEQAPYGPMLIQAPVVNPTPVPLDDRQIQRPPDNPKTTVAAYGRKLPQYVTPAAWGETGPTAALPSVFVNIVGAYADGVNATYFYVPTTQFLHEDEILTVTGFTGATASALNVTAQVEYVYNSVAAGIFYTSASAGVLSVSVPNDFDPGMLVAFSGMGEPSLNGYAATVVSASPTGFKVATPLPDYPLTAEPAGAAAEVSTFRIPMSAVVPLTANPAPTGAGLLTPTLRAGYWRTGGTASNWVLGTAPIAVSGATGTNWAPGGPVFQGQLVVDQNGYTQLALNGGVSGTGATGPAGGWSKARNATTLDNGVQWRNVGVNAFNPPGVWVGVVNFNVPVPPGTPMFLTGEVGNWDPAHTYGLLAPRLNQVWEVSNDQDFIFGLF